jgi:hypothetical protein
MKTGYRPVALKYPASDLVESSVASEEPHNSSRSADGLVFDSDREALVVYLERWLNNAVRDTVKENMLENYTYLVRRHITPELGHVRLKDLKPD